MITKKITLSGFAGTGKSTVGKILQKKLDFEFISIGNYSRDFAKSKYGLNINEFQEKCKKEPQLDKQIDEYFKEYCNHHDKIIVDYRLGFKFVNNSFNVLLTVSDKIAAERIKNANRKDENISSEGIKDRNTKMRQRFINLYNVDFTDEKNYHLTVNTDDLTPENVADLIIEKFKNTISNF